MGVIREDFILTDQFSSSFTRFLQLGNSAVSQLQRIDASVLRTESTMRRSIGGATGAIIGNMRQMGETANNIASTGFQRLETVLTRIEQNTRRVTEEQERHTRKVNETNSAAGNLVGTIKRLVAVAAGFKIGKDLIQLSDTMTQITARLNIMNDGLQSTEALNQMIFDSAQRSRASYLDTASAISKMGMNAGHVFDSNEELIVFMESINKQFAIGGASTQGMSAAMLQLTQAMAMGTLRGQELNSILENAPSIARNIEAYMGWETGSIKTYAEEGELTAKIVKNAMIWAADDINEQFNGIPTTWAQAWKLIKNQGIKSLEDVSTKINDFINSDVGQKFVVGLISGFDFLTNIVSGAIDLLVSGANFITENWDRVYPILISIGSALLLAGAAGAVSGLITAGAWLAAIWPFLAIGAAIGFVIFKLKQSSATWEEIGGKIGSIAGGVYSFIYNIVADIWNLFATFGEFLANFCDDPVASIVRLFTGMLDFILGIVETVADAIDAVVGTDMSSAIAGFRNDMNGWVDDKFGEQAITIQRMSKLDTTATSNQWMESGWDLGRKMDDMNFSMDSILGKVGGESPFDAGSMLGNIGKVGSVGKIENDVNIAEEDIKMLKDMSERQYVAMVNLTVPQTNVSVDQSVYGGGGSDMDAIGDYLKNLLLEQQSSHAG